MSLQLDLFAPVEVEEAIASPPKHPFQWKARTLVNSQKYHHAEFNIDHFCDVDGEENPFLSHHDIYLVCESKADEYIGCIYRFAADLPWMILSRGEGESRVTGMSFDAALTALVEWRKLCDLREKEQLEKWRWVKSGAIKN